MSSTSPNAGASRQVPDDLAALVDGEQQPAVGFLAGRHVLGWRVERCYDVEQGEPRRHVGLGAADQLDFGQVGRQRSGSHLCRRGFDGGAILAGGRDGDGVARLCSEAHERDLGLLGRGRQLRDLDSVSVGSFGNSGDLGRHVGDDSQCEGQHVALCLVDLHLHFAHGRFIVGVVTAAGGRGDETEPGDGEDERAGAHQRRVGLTPALRARGSRRRSSRPCRLA